jgi:hypothetical protein
MTKRRVKMQKTDRSPLGYALKTKYLPSSTEFNPAVQPVVLVSSEEKQELSDKFKSYFPKLATILYSNSGGKLTNG